MKKQFLFALVFVTTLSVVSCDNERDYTVIFLDQKDSTPIMYLRGRESQLKKDFPDGSVMYLKYTPDAIDNSESIDASWKRLDSTDWSEVYNWCAIGLNKPIDSVTSSQTGKVFIARYRKAKVQSIQPNNPGNNKILQLFPYQYEEQ